MTKMTEKQYLEKLKADSVCFRKYSSLSEEWKRRFLDFMTGKKTLPLTYDPIFKKIFDCDIHPERLSRLISSIIGTDVEVVDLLSNEGTLMNEESLLIMDIVVRLGDGALANVEMQKIPYAFAGERMSCYSSDLILRQYSKVKSEKGNQFSYKDMRKVYTIIFFEKSEKEYDYRSFEGKYIHHGSTKFDTGIKVDLLQEYWLIALDEFRKTTYPKIEGEQTAWISLLATEDIEETEKLIDCYPWLEEIYQEISEYMMKPEEVLNMFSEALRIMDRNTVKYMIEELQKKLDGKDEEFQKMLDEIDADHQKILDEKEADYQKILDEKEADYQKVLDEKEADYQKVLDEKEADYQKILDEKEADYQKILDEKEADYQKVLDEKEEKIKMLEQQLAKLKEE